MEIKKNLQIFLLHLQQIFSLNSPGCCAQSHKQSEPEIKVRVEPGRVRTRPGQNRTGSQQETSITVQTGSSTCSSDLSQNPNPAALGSYFGNSGNVAVKAAVPYLSRGGTSAEPRRSGAASCQPETRRHAALLFLLPPLRVPRLVRENARARLPHVPRDPINRQAVAP